MHSHHDYAVRNLDGRYYVSLTLHRAGRRDCFRVTEIAHELGYRITNVFATRSAVYLDFTVDESPGAQARAAATAADLVAGHAVPTALPGAPGGPTSFDAARARFLTAGRTPKRPNLARAARVAAAASLVTAAGFLITDHCVVCRLVAALSAAALIAVVWIVGTLVQARHLHGRRLRVIEGYDSAAAVRSARSTPVTPPLLLRRTRA